MRKLLLIVLAGVVSMVAAGARTTAAQATKEKPTFEETTQYLRGFLAAHGCTEYDRPDTHGQDCKFITKSDSCVIYGEEKYYDKEKDFPGPPNVKFEQWSVDLGTLDPFHLETSKFFQHDDGSRDDGLSVVAQNQTGGGMAFPVDSADSATHLIKALKHAITLCGGKKAPF
jgi:hypothetical protein